MSATADDIIDYPSPSTRYLAERFKLAQGSTTPAQFLCLAGQCGGRFGGLKRDDERQLWKKMEEEADAWKQRRAEIERTAGTLDGKVVVDERPKVAVRPRPHFLIECFYDVRPLCFDLDFHVFREMSVQQFADDLLHVMLEDVILKLFPIDSWHRRAVVCTAPVKKKRREVAVLAEDGSGNITEHSFFYFFKQGFHVIFPELLVTKYHGGFVRKCIIKALEAHYPSGNAGGYGEGYGRLIVDVNTAALFEPILPPQPPPPPATTTTTTSTGATLLTSPALVAATATANLNAATAASIKVKSLKPYIGRTLIVEDWEEIVDKSVFELNGLRMIGAHKVAKCPETQNHKGRKMADEGCERCRGRRNLDEGRPYSVADLWGGNFERPDRDAEEGTVERRLAVLRDSMYMSLAATLEELTVHKDATSIGGLQASAKLSDDRESYVPDYAAGRFEFSQSDRAGVAGTGMPLDKKARLTKGTPIAQRQLYVASFNAEVPGTMEQDKRVWITMTATSLKGECSEYYELFLSWLRGLFVPQKSYRFIRDGVKDNGPNLWQAVGGDIKTLSIHVPDMIDKRTGRRLQVDPATTFPSFRVFPQENFCVNVGRAHSSNRMFLEGFYSKKGQLYVVRPGCFSTNQPADTQRFTCSRAGEFFKLYERSSENHIGNERGMESRTRDVQHINYLLLRIVGAPMTQLSRQETSARTVYEQIAAHGGRGGWSSVPALMNAAAAAADVAAAGSAVVVPRPIATPTDIVANQSRGMELFGGGLLEARVVAYPVVVAHKHPVHAVPVSDEQEVYEANHDGAECYMCRSYIVLPRSAGAGESMCKCVVPGRVPPRFQCLLCGTQCDLRTSWQCTCADKIPTYKWKQPKK